MTRSNLTVFVAAAVGTLATSSSFGALMLTISEPGFANLVVTDAGNTGSLSYFGTYGDFQTNFVVGVSNKLTTPSPAAATLQLQSLNVKNLSTAGTTKTLTLTLTDDGYTFPGTTGTALRLDSSFGGTFTNSSAGNAATFQSFVVAPATTTGVQTYTQPAADPGTTSFSTNVVPVNFTRPATFTLTNTLTISLSNAFSQANVAGTTTVTTVPEPAMLSVGAAGVAWSLRRTRRR